VAIAPATAFCCCRAAWGRTTARVCTLRAATVLVDAARMVMAIFTDVWLRSRRCKQRWSSTISSDGLDSTLRQLYSRKAARSVRSTVGFGFCRDSTCYTPSTCRRLACSKTCLVECLLWLAQQYSGRRTILQGVDLMVPWCMFTLNPEHSYQCQGSDKSDFLLVLSTYGLMRRCVPITLPAWHVDSRVGCCTVQRTVLGPA
jgi:hypothetical protein